MLFFFFEFSSIILSNCFLFVKYFFSYFLLAEVFQLLATAKYILSCRFLFVNTFFIFFYFCTALFSGEIYNIITKYMCQHFFSFFCIFFKVHQKISIFCFYDKQCQSICFGIVHITSFSSHNSFAAAKAVSVISSPPIRRATSK